MTEKYSVTQVETGKFIFKAAFADSSPIKVYHLKGLNDLHPQFLLETDDVEFLVSLNCGNQRPYFLLESVNGRLQMVAERTLPVDGMNNFRDMGGYLAEDGKMVKWGKLYRSDHLYNATDQGVDYLQRLGIQTIIDYRSDDEIEKYPNRLLDEAVNTYKLDPAAHTAELSAQFTSSKQDEDKNLIHEIFVQKQNGTLVNRYDIVMQQYRNFVFQKKSQAAFGAMLKIAAKKETPAMVQHCRGGKDRTGFGAMLLLGVLGVKKEDLIEDYMLTAANREERNRVKMTAYRKLTDDEEILHYLYSLIETRPEFIEASIEQIEKEFGSITNYARDALGVSEFELDCLKKNYLV
ncbi:tyrosine-protein phosphatase [Listeria kieliensis]|uniref:Protein tyrosine phosphatase n=1 Tax=Listeria kieliensis TaxID=1621700 RepID=A0A3D8TQQ3_9LIST|nr:tyrosine-protein phosphatase [Listeria kieliensis]RDX01023.1 protein tyrosine phosphatase [Listeria kieliensis]